MSTSRTLQLPLGIPATDSQREQDLIQALEQCPEGHKRAEALWKLSRFYHYQAHRSDLATSLVDLMTKERDSDERRATFHLALGQDAQAKGKWDLALEQYALGLSRSPKERHTLYLLYNNGAHCRNMLGFYIEAEQYARLAIATDLMRHEAYINLGLSLQGQGDFSGAAWSFVEAKKINRSDPQATELLRQLLIDHPTLPLQSRWIDQELDLLERG
jgi:tetratricopeptide (TPR) repeat protein